MSDQVVLSPTGVAHSGEPLPVPPVPERGVLRPFTTHQDSVEADLSYWGACIAEEQGYELYLLPLQGEKQYYLRYKCPSTGKIYVSGIPPSIGRRHSIRSALRWKFGLQKRTNKPLFTEES